MKAAWLYYVTCKTTGLSYTGFTTQTLARRWQQHVSDAKTPKNKFHAAIKQYGPAAFEMVGLFLYSTKTEACVAEKTLIVSLDLRVLGLNTAEGGETPPDVTGIKRSDAHKAAIVKANQSRKGVWHPTRRPEHNAAIGVSNTGKKRLPETCEKISAIKKRYYAAQRSNEGALSYV